jgi:SAM-dependent methyltransferase
MSETAMTSGTPPARTRFQGVTQIVAFNCRMYAATALVLCVAMAALPLLDAWERAAVFALIVPMLYWTLASIAVSHYLYDRYPLYDFRWLHGALTDETRRWIDIHAGLDETSALIEAQFPGARGEVVDIFDARTMTEPSIRRARELRGSLRQPMKARYDQLPFEDGRFDAAFIFFAAHELRKHAQRVVLFKEVSRLLRRDGELALMEHMRNAWNIAAFGPGALHFFSRKAWLTAAREAGLEVKSESAKTPFVRVFVLRRAR